MRMMTCIMLCKVAEALIQKHGFQGAEKLLKQNPLLWKEMIVKTQTPTMLAAFNILADYQLENALYFFRSRIEDAFSSKSYCVSRLTTAPAVAEMIPSSSAWMLPSPLSSFAAKHRREGS